MHTSRACAQLDVYVVLSEDVKTHKECSPFETKHKTRYIGNDCFIRFTFMYTYQDA